MSKIDEVKKILYAVRSGDCSVSRGVFTIRQLFEPEHLGKAKFKTAFADEVDSLPVDELCRGYVNEPDESLLLSDEEIKEIGHETGKRINDLANTTEGNFTNADIDAISNAGTRALLQKQLAKDEARFERKCKECEYDPQAAEFGYFLDMGWLPPEEVKKLKVEIREQTLKEVGEWLNERLPAMCDMDERYHILIHREEIKELEQGRMP